MTAAAGPASSISNETELAVPHVLCATTEAYLREKGRFAPGQEKILVIRRYEM